MTTLVSRKPQVDRLSVAAILPAAGQGERLGSNLPKPLIPLGSLPLVVVTLKRLKKAYDFKSLFLCVEEKLVGEFEVLLREHGLSEVNIVVGGKTRAESVKNAFLKVRDEVDWVLIHDVARPFVREDSVEELIRGAKHSGASLLAEKATATVKEVNEKTRNVQKTIDRNRIFLAQTPQVFKTSLLNKAYERLGDGYETFTDEASMVEALPGEVRIVEGPSSNIKITTPSDLILAEAMVGSKKPTMRIGSGWDIHPLVSGRPLILGGVLIPHTKGLSGHSDADVVLHAVTDAVLGGMGEGDIGEWFSDTDEKNRGIESSVMLKKVMKKFQARGFRLINLDATIFAEEPKLKPYKEMIQKSLSEILGASLDQVNLKAKTQEGFGAVGEKKAISCQVTCLMERVS